MARDRRPSLLLETLEDRCVPATWGNPWPDAEHLTLSFAPDGTTVGGQVSQLYRTLDAVAPTAVWQREILRAFQAWASEAGLNVGLVADGGQALGTAGRPQGDARFGDVRLASAAFTGDVLVITSPFDVTAGTASGDVRLNSTLWGAGSGYDLYTAMLQEAGHALGIGNSDDLGSVMYEEYQGVRSGLGAGDVASIQALYGARLKDAFEGTAGNDSLAKASAVGLLGGSDGVLSLSLDADLGKGDRDFYSFRAPSLTGGLVVTLQRAGLSLVTPRVTVYDAWNRVVGSAVSTDPLGGDLTIKLTNVAPLGTYRVAVEGASGDSFDVGSYRLGVRSLPLLNSLTSSAGSAVQAAGEALANDDLHTNDSFLTSANLLGGLFAPASKFDVAYRASISDGWDVDFYRVTAPQTGGDVLQVMAWGTGKSQLVPKVSVFDAGRNLVAAEVLVNEAGVLTLQVRGVKAGATYYVKVEAGSRGAATGNYFLGADFRAVAVELAAFASGQLGQAKPAEQGALHVQRTGVFHFVMAVTGQAGSGVALTVTDKAGNVVGEVRAMAGETLSLTLTLTGGDYVVRLSAFRLDDGPLTSVAYVLRGIVLSDPIGPQPEGSSPPPPTSSGGTTTSSGTTASGGTTSGGTTSGDTSSSWYHWSAPPKSQPTAGGTASEDPATSGYAV